MAEGTSFLIDIGVQADGIEPAAVQLAALGDQLTTAGNASTAAAEAVKASEASYSQAERAADKAAKAVEKITVAADAQRGTLQAVIADQGLFSDAAVRAAIKLENLVARQGEAAAKAAAAKIALTDEAAALDRVKASAAAAAEAEAKIVKQLDASRTAAAAAAKEKVAAEAKAASAAKAAAAAGAKAQQAAQGTGKVNEIAEGLGKLGGPLGQLGQKAFGAVEGVKKLSGSLGSAGPYVAVAVAFAAIVAGIAAISVAALVGVAHITAYAVGLADAARSQLLLAEGITQSVSGGHALDSAIGALEKKVPLTRDELTSMAAELAKSGKKGAELADALENAAIKSAKAKFGPDWQKQMLSLDNQTKRLKTNFAGLFGGLNIEKLLEGFAKLVGLFDQSGSSGRAIKVVFDSLFQPLIDGIVAWIPKMVSAFIQFEILVLRALITIKPFGSKILLVAEALGIVAAIIIAVVVVALLVIIANLAILAIGFALVVGVVAAVVYAFVWLGQQLFALGEAIGGAMLSAWNWIVDTFNSVVSFLSGLSLGELGAQMIQGLVDGITGAGGAVLSAITGAVGGAIDGAKKLLGIASPSKVFAEIGTNTGEGMAAGVDASAKTVNGAIEAMVAPPDAPSSPAASPGAKAAAGAAGASSSSGGGADMSGAIFNFYGVEGAEDAVERFKQLLLQVQEGDLTQLGGAVAAGGG